MNVIDKEGALKILSAQKDNLSDVTNATVDGGYISKNLASLVKEIIDATIEVANRN